MNLLDAFERQIAAHPDRIAVIDPKGRAWSYRRLDARARALAGHFSERGLRVGDRVLIALGLDADLYAALAALWRIGAVAVLPEPALGLAGIRHSLDSLQPQAALLGGIYRLLPILEPRLRKLRLSLRLREGPADAVPVADLPGASPALVSFTTGSTGAPKAISRSHAFMQAQDAAIAPLIGTGGRVETDLVGFPVFVVANLGQGITSVLPDWPARRMDKATGPRLARLIERHGVSRLLLNPALVERVTGTGIPDCVQAIFTGGGPVFPQVIQRIRAARPDMRLVAVYGSTEAEPIAEIDATAISDADFAKMVGGQGLLAGNPVSAARVRIVKDEIQVAGGHVVQGYLDPARDCESKLRESDGTLWHRTGDAGRFDEQGRLWLLGRLGSQVAGHWPFPAEAAARSWPGVSNAALVVLDDAPALIIEGDENCLPDWHEKARDLNINTIKVIAHIPMDHRHSSKINMKRLGEILNT